MEGCQTSYTSSGHATPAHCEKHNGCMVLRSSRRLCRIAPYCKKANLSPNAQQHSAIARGWDKVVPVDTSQYPAINFQASRPLRFMTTAKGRQQIRLLAENYRKGEPVSTPGAEKTLLTASEHLKKLRENYKELLTTPEIKGLEDLACWIESVRQSGCLHDETEQVCQCLAHVQYWLYTYKKNQHMHWGLYWVSLDQILALPWNKYQTDIPAFKTAYDDIYPFDPCLHNYPLRSLPSQIKWPRACTYEPLSVTDILSTMGLPSAVEGFITADKELHDRQYYNCREMPNHDQVHAGRIIATLLIFLAPRLFSEYKEKFYSPESVATNAFTLKEIKQEHFECVMQEMNRVFTHMDHLLEELDQLLAPYPYFVQAMIRTILFETTHEGFGFHRLLDNCDYATRRERVNEIFESSLKGIKPGGAYYTGNYRRFLRLDTMAELPKEPICTLCNAIFLESINSFEQKRAFQKENVTIPADTVSKLMSQKAAKRETEKGRERKMTRKVAKFFC